MEGCYVPNNPGFAEPWKSPIGGPAPPSPTGQSIANTGPVADFSWPSPIAGSPKFSTTTSPITATYGGFQDLSMPRGSPVDFGMNGFNLSTMDLDPLANLFTFNTCSSPFKECPLFKDKSYHGHDVADVLLSLKHAVVHPGAVQAGPPSQSCGTVSGQLSPLSHYNQGMGISFSPQTSCSSAFIQSNGNTAPYPTLCPAQIQLNSNGCGIAGTQSGMYYPADIHQTAAGVPASTSSAGAANGVANSAAAQNGTVFPASMSVNLSMNMTMGFPDQFSPTSVTPSTTPQMQWATTVSTPMHHYNSPAPVSAQPYVQPLQMAYTTPSPVYSTPTGGAGGTYTFTAEFRPAETITLPPLEREFGTSASFKPIVSATYHLGGKQPDMPQTPNVAMSGSPKAKIKPSQSAASLNSLTAFHAGSLSPSDLENSMSIGGKTNLCRICGKTYARPSTLKTHMRTHSGERPYRCNTCSKSFSQAANLTAHIRTHSGEKPFRCPVCDRRFSQSSSVTTHMRTHSGERPYRCCMCKKAFSDSSTLTKHLRIHSGEKPYQCKLCLLRFSQSGNLNRHMRVHTTAT